jgi:hypothetical protein
MVDMETRIIYKSRKEEGRRGGGLTKGSGPSSVVFGFGVVGLLTWELRA